SDLTARVPSPPRPPPVRVQAASCGVARRPAGLGREGRSDRHSYEHSNVRSDVLIQLALVFASASAWRSLSPPPCRWSGTQGRRNASPVTLTIDEAEGLRQSQALGLSEPAAHACAFIGFRRWRGSVADGATACYHEP